MEEPETPTYKAKQENKNRSERASGSGEELQTRDKIMSFDTFRKLSSIPGHCPFHIIGGVFYVNNAVVPRLPHHFVFSLAVASIQLCLGF